MICEGIEDFAETFIYPGWQKIFYHALKPNDKLWVYFIEAETTKRIKVGKSKQPMQRIKFFRSINSELITPKLLFNWNLFKETPMHHVFYKYRHHGEWFSPGSDLLEFINYFEKYNPKIT